MKQTIYKVQMGFNGAKLPMVSQSFSMLADAIPFYRKQKAREDCTFCNIVKIEATVLDGNECDAYDDNFRFCI